MDDHYSSVLSKELVKWADLIFAMSPDHLFGLKALGAECKAFLLGAFATDEELDGIDGDGDHLAVPDPFGGPDEVYEETFFTLEKYVELAMKRLVGGSGR